MLSERFDRLSDGLTRLLETQERLKAENIELREALGEKDRELEELRSKVEEQDKEKGLVRERIDGLLGRLDGLIQNA